LGKKREAENSKASTLNHSPSIAASCRRPIYGVRLSKPSSKKKKQKRMIKGRRRGRQETGKFQKVEQTLQRKQIDHWGENYLGVGGEKEQESLFLRGGSSKQFKASLTLSEPLVMA